MPASESGSSSGTSGSRSSSPGSSSSSSRSPSPPTAHASFSRTSQSANTSNTSSYIPPDGFRPVSLSDSLTLNDLREAQSSGKQLWTIKLPDGIHPSLLEGLVFDLPDDGSSGKKSKRKGGNAASKTLGSLKVSTRDEETGEKKSKDVYHLYGHSGGVGHADDAKNSKPGQSGKKAKKDGEKSQLANDAGDAENSQFGAHMTGLKAYVAVEGGRPGQITTAPLAISHHLEFVLAPPDVSLTAPSSAGAETSTGFTSLFAHPEEEAESKKLAATSARRELKGYFAPAGSLYDEEYDTAANAPAIAPTSSDSSAKKRKKDEIVDPAETSSSPSSKKSKVKEEKRSSKDSKGKKDKKRKSG